MEVHGGLRRSSTLKMSACHSIPPHPAPSRPFECGVTELTSIQCRGRWVQSPIHTVCYNERCTDKSKRRACVMLPGVNGQCQFYRTRFRISVRAPTILTMIFSGFPQSLKRNPGTVQAVALDLVSEFRL
jgi:hypothetical protein